MGSEPSEGWGGWRELREVETGKVQPGSLELGFCFSSNGKTLEVFK